MRPPRTYIGCCTTAVWHAARDPRNPVIGSLRPGIPHRSAHLAAASSARRSGWSNPHPWVFRSLHENTPAGQWRGGRGGGGGGGWGGGGGGGGGRGGGGRAGRAGGRRGRGEEGGGGEG